jgi:tetratricopeptide (TPR) repeat protein
MPIKSKTASLKNPANGGEAGSHAPTNRMKSAVIALCCLVGLGLVPVRSSAQTKNDKDKFDRAAWYFFQKKFSMAESLLLQVIESDPDNPLAYSYLGDIYFIKKRYDEALDLYRKSIDLNPEAGENYFRIGQIYYYKKDGSKAVDYFKKAIKKDERLTFAYYHIGLTYLMLLRDKENTIQNWEEYLKIARNDPQYDKIKRAIELLKDPRFVIPPPGSDTTIEEALLLGGLTIEKAVRKTKDQEAGHESKKTKQKLEDIYMDDDM